jgi:ATP-binding protein involved in chromosome partitioning
MDVSLTGLRQGKRGIVFTWSDRMEAELDPRTLRLRCTCARCISETTGQPLLNPATVPEDIKLTGIEPIGNYAYRCQFSDGHNTGLYTLELLRELCERAAKS